MSISPVQMILPSASADGIAPARPSASMSSSAPLAALAPAAGARDSSSADAESTPAALSTDLKVDDQHQVYYEFIDPTTGNVLFEIPPEALRAIGESLIVPRNGDSSTHRVDVKS